MKIVAERSIPYLQGLLEPYAEVLYLDNTDITQDNIRDADALIVRSITKCRPELLKNSSVRFIATATAGVDHIDAEYCEQAGIRWERATGCNAIAVAQYVFAALCHLEQKYGYQLVGRTIGIIGVGQVGRQVERIARAWGMKVLLYDPPRVEAEGWEGFSSLEDIQAHSDIITLHVPLTEETHHMVHRDFIRAATRCSVLINACRGAVTDSQALLWAKHEGLVDHLIIDCWENEPQIHQELLSIATLASPHIAGFSADGKHRGSRMAALAVAQHFGLNLSQDILQPRELIPPSEVINLSDIAPTEQLRVAMLATLDLDVTDRRLRAQIMPFEEQRRKYIYPREMSAYTVLGASPHVARALQDIGFIVK